MKLNQYQRAKLNKILIIAIAVLVVFAIIISIIYFSMKSKKNEKKDYTDTIINKNLYQTISIDLSTKEVKRDGKDTTLQEEFEMDDAQASLLLSSQEEIKNYFSNSTVDVKVQDNIVNLTNIYQTKTIFVEAEKVKDSFDGKVITLQDGLLYMICYDTQKRTKAAYEFLQFEENIKTVKLDKISIVEPINDESQTVYGETADDGKGSKAHGLSAMGINTYKKMIKDNGNPSEVTIATIGYGAVIDHSYFKNRISEDYYNFIDDVKEIHETIPQGSRVLEVIKESTTDNVSILPLVVVNDENYTTTSSILQALTFAKQKADVIAYEFVHEEEYMINLALENIFKANIPVCCVTRPAKNENEKIYPASNATTIAVSSVNQSSKTTNYSGQGEYIDFVASSTDVQEIFNTPSNVSKWSGAGYSNAHIVSLIALIKTYNKQATIVDIYNTLRSYCQDLGDKGKDAKFGYGLPNFSSIKISDIDKTTPTLKQEDVKLDDSKWEKQKNVQIKATDNIRMFGWNITKSPAAPTEWNKVDKISSTLDTSKDVKENGSYYAWVTDSAGNAAYVTFEITKIDNTAPKITYTVDDTKQSTEKYDTINVTANDDQSGLHENAYSWDKQNWSKDSNTLKVTENGSYTVYVRDALENISEQKIVITSFPEEGTAEINEGNIIKEIKVSANWNVNTNKEVIIILNNNLNITDWEVTVTDEMPERFRPSQSEDENFVPSEINGENTTVQNTAVQTTNVSPYMNNSQGKTNITITLELDANTQYYLWVKDASGEVNSQGFTIRK